MSALDFEWFQLGDWWDKIKDNPEQLILGAADPFGAELWGNILGKDYDPMVNVLGGPMGSGWAGLGSGGIYDRADAAGVSTKDAMNLHDAAEVYAGSYLMNGSNPFGGEGGFYGDNQGLLGMSNMNDPSNLGQLQGLLGGGNDGQQEQAMLSRNQQIAERERQKRMMLSARRRNA